MATIQDFYSAAKNSGRYFLAIHNDSSDSETVRAHAQKWGFIGKSDAKEVLGAFRKALKQEMGADFFKRLPSELRMRLENLQRNGKGVREIIRDVEAFSEQDKARIDANNAFVDASYHSQNFKQHLAKLLNCTPDVLPHPIANFGDADNIDMQQRMKAHLQSHYVGVMPDLQALPPLSVERILDQALAAALAQKLSALNLETAPPVANAHRVRDSAQAHATPYGLRTWTNAPADVAYGQRQLAPEDAGLKKGPYLLAGSKLSGVEPGFVGTKAWTDDDTRKMLDPKHPFAQRVVGLLLENLSTADLNTLGNQLELYWDPGASIERNELLEAIRGLPADQVASSPLVAATLRKLDDDRKQNSLSPSDSRLLNLTISYTSNTEAKFSRQHYVKLDYHEKLLNKYTIAPRAHVHPLKNFGHRLGRRQSPRDINGSAITEAMANDITRSFGIVTQKLKLVHAQYPDGSPKLLLDGTHMYDPIRPSATYADLDSQLHAARHEGVLVMPSEAGQQQVVDTSIDKLGYNKIFLLGLADRDAVGSKGQNKGRLGNQFASIDPGKSLNPKAMGRKDLRNDMAAEPGIYKNFSIFDQSPFSERMEGVRDLVGTLDNYSASEQHQVFTQYDNAFGSACTNQELRFAKEINAIRDAYRNRLEYIKTVFADRLAVYEWTLPGKPDVNQAENQVFHAQTLDTLDMLEKISTKDVKLQKDSIQLAQPSVPYDKRQAWQVKAHASDPDCLVFSPVKGNPKEAIARLQNFLMKNSGNDWRQQMEESGITFRGDAGRADSQLVIRKDKMEAAKRVFSVEELRKFFAMQQPPSAVEPSASMYPI